MSGEAAPDDQAITLTLPLSKWNLVMGHIGRAPFREVAGVVEALAEQMGVQIRAPSRAAPDAVSPDSSSAPPKFKKPQLVQCGCGCKSVAYLTA